MILPKENIEKTIQVGQDKEREDMMDKIEKIKEVNEIGTTSLRKTSMRL